MANGINTLTWDRGGPQKIKGFRGLSYGTGTMILSTTSTFGTSSIEKRFRRCQDVKMQCEGGYLLNWTRSATNKKGQVTCYALSALTSGGGASALMPVAPASTVTGTFTAFGV